MLKKRMLMVLALGACAVTPLTHEETDQAVGQTTAIEACFQKGWIQSPATSAAYLSSMQQTLANRGDPALIAQRKQVWQGGLNTLTPEVCRKVEMYGIQHAQLVAEREQDLQELSNSLDEVTQNNIQQMQNSRPQTVMCQHYQWGNMTACNSF